MSFKCLHKTSGIIGRMKKLQKGFVTLLMLILIALLVIAGGVYLYMQKNRSSTAVPNDIATTTAEVESNTTSVFRPVAPGVEPYEMSRNSDFSMVRFQYNRDATSVYYVEHGVVYDLPGADLSTFEILTGSIFETNPYAVDKNNVYYLGAVIPGADPSTFHVINGGDYAVDNHAAYWEGNTISGVDLTTFSVDSSEFTQAQDNSYLYCGGTSYPLGNTCANIESGTQTYTNTQYDFSVSYPGTLGRSTAPNYKTEWWYPNFKDETDIVSITNAGYPMLISTTPDLSNCTNYPNAKIVLINGLSFTMLQATDGSNTGAGTVEYRVQHNNLCYDLLRIVPANAQPLAQSIDQTLDSIIQTFQFTR